MDKNEMPSNISYTLLIHGGSLKAFLNKMAKDYPDLQIKMMKKKAIHYYVALITENGKTEYTKDQIYKLPIMAMREEFSNYLFFKSIKAYNNVLKFMYDGKNNTNAPYDLYVDMLTGIEKYKLAKINRDIKCVSYKKEDENSLVSVYGASIHNMDNIYKLFNADEIKLDDEEVDYALELKKQKLTIGII